MLVITNNALKGLKPAYVKDYLSPCMYSFCKITSGRTESTLFKKILFRMQPIMGSFLF